MGGMRNLTGGVRNLNPGARPPAPASSPPAQPPKPVAGPTAAPAQPPRVTPPNIAPPGATPPARPSILNRPPQVAPPKFIAPGRTGTGAPPPSGGQRPGGARGGPAPGGPASAKPISQGNKPNSGTPMKLTPEMIDRLRSASARGQRMSISDIAKPQAPGAGGPGAPGRGQDSRSGPGSAARIAGRPQTPATRQRGRGRGEEEGGPGRVIGSDSRHKGRTDKGRQGGPRVDRGSVVIGAGGVEMIDVQSGSRRGPARALLRKHLRRQQQLITKIEGQVEIALPITVRSLSEAIGMKVGELTNRLLKETSQLYGSTRSSTSTRPR